MTFRMTLILSFLFFAKVGWTQEMGIQSQLKKDVFFLADDKLEGRLPGTKGEKKAAEYIKKRMKALGLKAANGNSYFHSFTFSPPIKLIEGLNNLKVNGENWELNQDFYPVALSGNGEVNGELYSVGFGIEAPELSHQDLKGKNLKGKIILLNLGSPDGIHPHSKFKAYHDWRKRIDEILIKEPAAIICYNMADDLSVKGLRKFTKLQTANCPIIGVYDEEKASTWMSKTVSVVLEVGLKREKIEGTNVLGLLDNGSDKTVVVGAHYDHLGYGEYGNSRYMGPPLIHNGADDNASGVALMLGLAEQLAKSSKNSNYNYLFLAFSAEELGLLGSNAFVNSDLLKVYDPIYMLNFDMVGRLNALNELGIFGNGTAEQWGTVLNSLDSSGLKISRNPSGMGSSDHTSFYLQEIPCLHLFSGTHEDYHKPSDDADKINFEGINRIFQYAVDLCAKLESQPTLTYRKTKSGKSRKVPSFKVTLGIIPDYFGDAKGLKIDGVSEGKPAQKAGLKKGDIIIKLGDTAVSDMMTYMTALGSFDKGDKTTVILLRDGKEITFNIQF